MFGWQILPLNIAVTNLYNNINIALTYNHISQKALSFLLVSSLRFRHTLLHVYEEHHILLYSLKMYLSRACTIHLVVLKIFMPFGKSLLRRGVHILWRLHGPSYL